MPSHVVMFVYNDVQHDARVWREASTLSAAGWTVSIIGLQTGGLPSSESNAAGQVIRVGSNVGVAPGSPSPYRDGGGATDRVRWLAGYWQNLEAWRKAATRTGLDLVGTDSVVWHGHDLTGLLPAAGAQARRPGHVVYDSHELFMEAGSAARLPGPAHALLRMYEDRLARKVDAVITVNESISAELGRRFRCSPTVVMNCPEVDGPPEDRQSSPLRTQLGLGDRPIVLHHGGIAEGRGDRATVAPLEFLRDGGAMVI